MERNALPFSRRSRSKTWTNEEVGTLRKYYPRGGAEEVQKHLNRSRSSIYHKAIKEGLSKKKILWTPEELKVLSKVKDINELVKLLPRHSRRAIKNKAWKMGVELRFERLGKYEDPRMNFSNLPKSDLGWFAGVIDGEGTIVIAEQRKRKKKPDLTTKLIVTNASINLVKKISDMTGLEIKKCRRKKHNFKPLYKVEIQRVTEVLHVLEHLLPYLVAKREQAKLAIRYCRSRIKRGPCAHYSEEEVKIGREIQKLNKLCARRKSHGISNNVFRLEARVGG